MAVRFEGEGVDDIYGWPLNKVDNFMFALSLFHNLKSDLNKFK